MISVIICTYNRAQSLRCALASIDNLTIPTDMEVELIVVNNNSSDNTKAVIEQFVQTAKIPTRYVFERAQGLSSARNAGLREARGDILAFTDDDCLVDSAWLICITKEFSSDPTLALLGGRIELYNPADLPITILTSRERKVFSLTSGPFNLIYGCNMVFTRSVVAEVGNFDCHLDSSSGTSLTADDMDFMYRVHKKGFKILYSPDVLVWHNHGRRTKEQKEKITHGYVRGRGAFYCKHILQKDTYVLKMMYWHISELLRGILKKVRAGEVPTTDSRILILTLNGMVRWFALAIWPMNKAVSILKIRLGGRKLLKDS